MRQHDVYRNPNERSTKFAPYLVVLQSHLTQTSSTVVVAPPILRERIGEKSRLFPEFLIESTDLVLAINELGAIRRDMLRQVVTNVASERGRISAALDLLFAGY